MSDNETGPLKELTYTYILEQLYLIPFPKKHFFFIHSTSISWVPTMYQKVLQALKIQPWRRVISTLELSLWISCEEDTSGWQSQKQGSELGTYSNSPGEKW